MDKIDILIKAITLLYKESLLPEHKEVNSKDIVTTLLEMLTSKTNKKFHGGTEDIGENLIYFIETMLNDMEDGYDKDSLLQSLTLIVKDDEQLLEIIKNALEVNPEDIKGIRRSVTILKKSIRNYYKEERIVRLLNEASYKFIRQRNKITDVNQYVSELITRLESLQLDKKANDPAITGELDVSETDKVSEVIETVKDVNTSTKILKTGWKKLNRMLQGGFRKGQLVAVGALQHKYKSGFTLSLFMQLALFNKPEQIENKKPLLLLISLEDDLTNILLFMYNYLYINEYGNEPDTSNITSEDMSKYIKDKLGVNGYHIKIIRADPTNWDYRGMFNYIINLESQGYVLDGVFIDYLNMLPKVGCISSGAMGTDIRDLFRRTRNFFSVRNCLVLTPHQFSTEAKQLLRNGIPPATFVKEVAEKGYYEGTRQLDQDLDLELYVNVAKIGNKYGLTVQRGKHKIPTIIPDELKYFVLPFPKNGPIIHDEDKEYEIGYYSPEDMIADKSDNTTNKESMFDI